MNASLSPHNYLNLTWSQCYSRRTTIYIRRSFVKAPEKARNTNLMNHCRMLTITADNNDSIIELRGDIVVTMTVRMPYQRFAEHLL